MNEQQLLEHRANYLTKCIEDGNLGVMCCQTCIIQTRMIARQILKQYNAFAAEWRRWSHQKNKLEHNGIKAPFIDIKLQAIQKDWDVAEKRLAKEGEMMLHLLTLWQEEGASFQDLCRLCNVNDKAWMDRIPDERKNDLAGVAMVYHLDYSDHKSDFVECGVDGPLTHCLLEFLAHQMTHNLEIKRKTHKALTEFFPELMEKALIRKVDENGVARFYDKDGYEVGVEVQ